MASKLGMGLDDIIKSNKSAKKFSGRGGSRGAARGGARRGGKAIRGSPSGVKRLASQSPLKNRSMNGKWQHDKANGVPAKPAGPARLSISNLDFGVNDQDINELFSRCGHIVKACVHYDSNGRSQGTAEVVFRSQKEASAAVGEYNGRLLDGRAMSVQVVGGGAKPASLASRMGSPATRGNRFRKVGRTGAVAGKTQRGRGGSGLRGGRGRKARSSGPPVTKEDLDKQMEEYKMQTDAV